MQYTHTFDSCRIAWKSRNSAFYVLYELIAYFLFIYLFSETNRITKRNIEVKSCNVFS